MAVRSIVEVDVNDSRFKEFLALFGKYDAATKAQPAAWGKINKAAAGATAELKQQQNFVTAVATAISEAVAAESKLRVNAAASNREFSSLAKTTKAVATNIKDGAMWLLKWASIGGLGAGLLGAGSLFGIGSLAQRVSNVRRESQALGVDAGTLKALRNNYGSAVDVDSMLEKINEARNDRNKKWLFGANGIMAGDVATRSNAELFEQLIPNLRKRFLNSRGGAANLPGLTDFTDLGTLTRLSMISPEELARIHGQTQIDKRAFALPDETQSLWQNFNKILTRSGEQIETTFIKGLQPLLGPLGQLSTVFSNLVRDTLANPNMGRWIEEFGHGIQKAAEFIGSDEFTNKLSKFGSAIAEITSALMKLAGWVNEDSYRQQAGTAVANAWESLFGLGGQKYPNAQQAAPALAMLEKNRGLPAGVLSGIYAAETSSGANVPAIPRKAGGALGPFQMEKATADQYKVGDRTDFAQSSIGAANYLADLRRRYNGDIAKAVAAYNWGPTHVDEVTQKYGDKWQMHIPAETQRELRMVLQVNNSTGGNAQVNLNQAGQQN